MNFLAISGSLRAASTNTLLLQALAKIMPSPSHIGVFDGLAAIPAFDPDLQADGNPVTVAALEKQIASADGLILAAPEYAHGIPGALKNALDWLVAGQAVIGKPVMLVHASQRSDISRKALREVLKTMSLRLFDGAELEVALLGKAPVDIQHILGTQAAKESLISTLQAFNAFVAGIKPSL